jgi:orotidine-5'-phosphate decarboxylase
MRKPFQELLQNRWTRGFFICVGLDSEYAQIPERVRTDSVKETLFHFNRKIIETTGDLVCAYKPNIGFYEGAGIEGLEALIATIQYIHTAYPEIPVILDAKRADIGHTNKAYVKAVFEVYGADATTVHPYLGQETVQSFLDRKDKGIFVLCKTSNPGAGEFQDLPVMVDGSLRPLYQVIAHHVAKKWNQNKNCGLVIGASYPEELKEVRQIVGDMPILLPGIGAQGGGLSQALAVGLDTKGRGLIVNASRSVIYASAEVDFALVAGQEVERLHNLIHQLLRIKS